MIGLVTAAIVGAQANSALHSINENSLNGVYSQDQGTNLKSSQVVATTALGVGIMTAFSGAALVLTNWDRGAFP